MLAGSLVEEFEIREDEPWYDQQDLQQGEAARGGGEWAVGGAVPGGCPRLGDPRRGEPRRGRGGFGLKPPVRGWGRWQPRLASPRPAAAARGCLCSPGRGGEAAAARYLSCERHRERGELRAARPVEPTRGGGTAESLLRTRYGRNARLP